MKKALLKHMKGLLARLRGEEGFTLVELMIVVAIIAMLGAIAVPTLMNQLQKARYEAAKVQIREFGTALQDFNMSKGRFPSAEEGLESLKTEGIMKSIPKDPWQHEYVYTSSENEYDIICLGRDGKEGGDGLDKDIKSSELE